MIALPTAASRTIYASASSSTYMSKGNMNMAAKGVGFGQGARQKQSQRRAAMEGTAAAAVLSLIVNGPTDRARGGRAARLSRRAPVEASSWFS